MHRVADLLQSQSKRLKSENHRTAKLKSKQNLKLRSPDKDCYNTEGDMIYNDFGRRRYSDLQDKALAAACSTEVAQTNTNS